MIRGRFVLAVNSQNEGGPRVAVEALSAGVPVVMANFPGSESFKHAPFVWTVEKLHEWPEAVEGAHRADLNLTMQAELASFLSRYRRDAVGCRLTAVWLGVVRSITHSDISKGPATFTETQ